MMSPPVAEGCFSPGRRLCQPGFMASPFLPTVQFLIRIRSRPIRSAAAAPIFVDYEPPMSHIGYTINRDHGSLPWAGRSPTAPAL